MRIHYSDNCVVYKKKFHWEVEYTIEILDKVYTEKKIAYKDEDLIRLGINLEKLNVIIEQHLENVSKFII